MTKKEIKEILANLKVEDIIDKMEEMLVLEDYETESQRNELFVLGEPYMGEVLDDYYIQNALSELVGCEFTEMESFINDYFTWETDSNNLEWFDIGEGWIDITKVEK